VWVSSPIGLWIANHPTASRLPATAESEHRLWRAERFPPTDEKKWRVSLADALLHYACVGREPDVIASIDSALNSGRLSETQLDDIFSASPRRVRRMRKKVARRSTIRVGNDHAARLRSRRLACGHPDLHRRRAAARSGRIAAAPDAR
jgi:hypothetical protein